MSNAYNYDHYCCGCWSCWSWNDMGLSQGASDSVSFTCICLGKGLAYHSMMSGVGNGKKHLFPQLLENICGGNNLGCPKGKTKWSMRGNSIFAALAQRSCWKELANLDSTDMRSLDAEASLQLRIQKLTTFKECLVSTNIGSGRLSRLGIRVWLTHKVRKRLT